MNKQRKKGIVYKKNYKRKSTRSEIIHTILMCGIIPYEGLNIKPSPRTYKMKITEMVKEGILDTVKVKNGRRTYRMVGLAENAFGKIVEEVPDKYEEIYRAYGMADAKRAKYAKGPDSLRVITNTMAYMMMVTIGLRVKPEEKLSLGSDGTLKDEGKYYYTSREVKSYTEYMVSVIQKKDSYKKVVASKMTGLMLTPGGDYLTYSISASIPEWSRSGEAKMQAYTDRILTQKMETATRLENALILADGNKQFQKLLIPPDLRSERSMNDICAVFEHVYGIPYDNNGRRMLEIMTQPEWARQIKEACAANKFNTDTTYCPITCDAYMEDQYVFILCVPDMKRYQKFLDAAETVQRKEKFIIICFDWQKELAMVTGGKNCKIFSTPFDAFYKALAKKG